jgi:hypothetical protein
MVTMDSDTSRCPACGTDLPHPDVAPNCCLTCGWMPLLEIERHFATGNGERYRRWRVLRARLWRPVTSLRVASNAHRAQNQAGL